MTAPGPARRPRRTRSGAVLGGVCAGIARSAGLDPLLLRIAVVAVTVLTGGAGLAAYLVAWVLIPREDDVHDGDGGTGAATGTGGAAATPDDTADTPAAASAGHAAPPQPGTTDLPDGTVPPQRSPGTVPEPARGGDAAGRGLLDDYDDAATALGERLRAPEVQAGARRAASSVSQALSAGVDGLGRRIRRDPPR